MTKAREGSQVPARSRKFRTFAGSDMPETTRPAPNSRPRARLTKKDMSASDRVANDKDGDEGDGHEHGGCDHRAGGEPGKSADAVARGAAIAPDGAEADEQAGGNHQGNVRRNGLRDRFAGDGHHRQRRR